MLPLMAFELGRPCTQTVAGDVVGTPVTTSPGCMGKLRGVMVVEARIANFDCSIGQHIEPIMPGNRSTITGSRPGTSPKISTRSSSAYGRQRLIEPRPGQACLEANGQNDLVWRDDLGYLGIGFNGIDGEIDRANTGPGIMKWLHGPMKHGFGQP